MNAVKPCAPPPSNRAPRRPVSALRRAHALQEHINRRFSGITPDDIDRDGVAIMVVDNLNPPQGFEDVWHVFDGDTVISNSWTPEKVDNLWRSGVLLLVGDPQVEVQVERVCNVASDISSMAQDGPPVFFLPHGLSSEGHEHADNQYSVYDNIMESGVDDVVAGEPEGWELALAVRCKKSKQDGLSNTIYEQQQMRWLQNSINNIVWNYLPFRCHVAIPPIDHNLRPGTPSHVNGCTVGAILGKGRFGNVHSLWPPEGGPAREVVKCVDKTEISSVTGLQSVADQINIMTELTKQWPHPHIVKFYEAYHSTTHMIYRMEHGGDRNLYKRLKLRDIEEPSLPLSSGKVATIIAHASQALAHLHSICHIAHRDIKPENVCLQETDNHITAKLADFDVAIFASISEQCRTFSGTFPFMAPELFSKRAFAPLPTDVWSLGVLVYELVCKVHTFDHIIGMSNDDQHHQAERTQLGGTPSTMQQSVHVLNKRIAEYFLQEDPAGKFLDIHLRSQMRPLAEPTRVLLNGLCCTVAAKRFSAPQAAAHAQAIVRSQLAQGTGQ